MTAAVEWQGDLLWPRCDVSRRDPESVPQGECTFIGVLNDAVTKKKTISRMTTRWTSPTVEVFELYAPGPYGKETKMMKITYTKRAE